MLLPSERGSQPQIAPADPVMLEAWQQHRGAAPGQAVGELAQYAAVLLAAAGGLPGAGSHTLTAGRAG